MAGPGQVVEPPWQGAVPVTAAGVGAWVRIPFPGKGNLVLSLRPPAQWKGPSPSAIFIMEQGSKYKGLRLDYSFNKKTNCIDYHWNRNGPAKLFPGFQDHMPAGRVGTLLYKGARAFKTAGTVLVVIGVAVDLYSIAESSNPLRRSTQVVSAWAAAWAGAEVGGMGGAELGAAGGTIVPGVGNVIGGIVIGFIGAAAGGYAGYRLGKKAGGMVYDWAADTIFTDLPKVAVPEGVIEENSQ